MTDADTNRTIAEAMGWTDFEKCQYWHHGRPPRPPRNTIIEKPIPDYLHDANTALEAAREITREADDSDASPWLWYDRGENVWKADSNTAALHSRCADTPAAALCAMILAVLAERAGEKTCP